MFNSIDESLAWMFSCRKNSKGKNIERLNIAINELDIRPTYPIIHIAGTNGKGSVACYIRNILKHTNRHVGMFTSPFVVRFNDRIMINDRMISDSEIMHYSNILFDYSKSFYEKTGEIISFFELNLLMALMYYKDRSIDLAIIECGVGGLHDSTNVLKCDLAIISSIGYDHMATLGNSLESIASHKLGIVWDNMTCITAVDEGLHNQFNEYAKAHNNKMIFVNSDVSDISISDGTYFTYKNHKYRSNLLGVYQAYNASIAIEAARFIDPNIPQTLIEYGLEESKWPGRMEVISRNPFIILDGAHNISAIEALKNSLEIMYTDKKVNIVFSALQDKAYKNMLNILDNVCDNYYFTELDDERATNPHEFVSATTKPSMIIPTLDECVDYIWNNPKSDEVVLFTGSLHFISQAREKIIKKLIQ